MISMLLTLAFAAPLEEQSAFEQHFTGKTMRFDYYHSGTASEEHVSLDEVRIEGDWPGSRVHLIDPLDVAKYRLVVSDADTDATLFTRGFASIYGEWETTGEAHDGIWRTFHETQRFPEPRAPVRVTLQKRDPRTGFTDLYSGVVDPGSRFVNRAAIPPAGQLLDVEVHGPPATCVDLLILGDGYTAAEHDKFAADVKRLVNVLLDTEPFRTFRDRFNVRALHVPAAASGISNPRKGEWVDSPFGLSFNSLDSDRYVLTLDNARARDVAAQAPYDALYFLFNGRKYGGGGIYNLWATCASDTAPAEYVFVHEFGHSFAGLADEYYTSPVSYEETAPKDVEPLEPNVTALLDPAKLKWRDLVAAGTALPTPWDKETYDRESHAYQERRARLIEEGASEETMEGLFEEVKKSTAELFAKEPHAGVVGAFEGAMYEAQGLYRPALDCIMFTRNPKDFCPVCRRHVERVIQKYVE